jgi:arginyl-tRNA--protein-N-Asp/Glu arginylyltransferase
MATPPGPPPHLASAYPALPPPVRVSLVTLGEQPCPYLPGRVSESRAGWADEIPPALYHRFMDAGFRRSGKLLYQPVCRGCRACVPIRVPVNTFRPSKSQRRARRRIEDLDVTVAEPVATDEKFDLYRRYVVGRHQRPADEEDRESFERFLYDSPVDTLELCYRDNVGRLLAVGLCDVSAQSLSSVYFYFEPDERRRGLGTAGAVYEIETAAKLGIPYYYLGYWVDGCGAMVYKADFRPAEALGPDGVWRPMERGDRAGEARAAPRPNQL